MCEICCESIDIDSMGPRYVKGEADTNDVNAGLRR